MDSQRSDERDVLVEVRGLRKRFGAIQAVDDVSFEVCRGEVLGFLGPNGAGKTTVMKMVTGFLEPDGGEVRIGGTDVARDPLGVKRRIGYLPENAPSYGEMTVESFLRFVADARALQEPGRSLADVADKTGLGRVLPQTIDTLSKGFRRRVGLAAALIHDPEVLILDEPTDGLDPNQKALVQELIRDLSSDKAIVLSTHILDEAEKVCNRAMIISEGRLLVDSTPDALMKEAAGENVVRVEWAEEPDSEVIQSLKGLSWCERVAKAPGHGIYLFPADGENHVRDVLQALEGQDVLGIHVREGRLDDLFRDVTGGVCA